MLLKDIWNQWKRLVVDSEDLKKEMGIKEDFCKHTVSDGFKSVEEAQLAYKRATDKELFYIGKTVDDKYKFICPDELEERGKPKNFTHQGHYCLFEVAKEKPTRLEVENKNPDHFVFIAPTDWYGGDQSWYRDLLGQPNKEMTGCGSVAAANVILYYAQGSMPVLYPNASGITMQDFIDLANEFYNLMKQMPNPVGKIKIGPESLGVWNLDELAEAVSSYGKTKKINFISEKCSNGSSSWKEAYDFIERGLQYNNPVVLLSRVNPYAASLADKGIAADKHFVTITEVFPHIESEYLVEERTAERTFVKENGMVDFSVSISTWGKKTEIMSFKKLWTNYLDFSEELGEVGEYPVVKDWVKVGKFAGNVSLVYFIKDI